MGFYRQKHVSGLPSPSPGYLPYPGIKPTSFMFPAFAVGSLPLAPPRKPIRKVLKGIFWSMTPWEVWNPQIKEYMRKYRKRSTENCYTIRILVFFFSTCTISFRVSKNQTVKHEKSMWASTAKEVSIQLCLLERVSPITWMEKMDQYKSLYLDADSNLI